MLSQRKLNIFLEAFLDGCTGAALFGRLRIPGSPQELIDSRTVEQFLASGDYEKYMEMARALQKKDRTD